MIRKVLLSPMNMSVKNTLYLSLFTMNLLLILIAVFSWMAFHSAGRTTRIIADELIPVTEAVSSLTHMNAELSAIVSGLVFIAKQDDLEDKYEMARKILSRQQEILAELRQEYGAAGGETEYHDVNLYSMQLEKKLEILNRKMASRLDLLDQLKEKAKTLFAAHADFIVGVSPIADDAQFDLTMGLEGVRQDSEGENDLIRQVETLSRVLELKAEGNLLVGFLEIAINMQDGAGLPPLIERFDASLSRLESDMADLSLQEREGFQLVTEAAGVIMGLGTTGSSVFELRKQYLALQDQLTSELMEVEEIGRLIDGSVSELSEKIKESVNKTRERSEILMSWGRYTILVVSLLSVLLSVMVSWFYVKGRIVSRLEHLKGLMMALANKDFNKIIEISHVSDEIGEMETALHTFREKLIEKEKLVRDVEEQKNRTEAIINHMNEGLITIDERGFVMSFNAGAEKMFGYQAGEVIGQNINMLIPHSQKDTDRSVPAQIKSDLGTRQELTALRKNGDEFPVALSVATTNVSGLPIFISIIQDVSEQKMRESLLHQAKNQAEEASRAKSDFLANMSHEIRTPMNAVMGMSALLLDTPLNEEQTEWARAINASGSSLLNIINDIIDISKIEAGKLTLEKIDFDLFDILQEVANLYTFQAREKGLEMLLDIDPDLPEFMVGDPVRIKQIFANLISNALKFTTRGHILIKLSHKGEQEGGIRMECRVEDTGIGIPKSKQKKIFEKFTQAEESTTRKFGGTGLGLTIVSQLVGIMGGSIRVESVEGRGSVFIFEVMLGNSLKNIDKPGELQKEAGAVNALVVDDYALTRFMLKELLERAGIICAEAASAEQAEEILKEHGPYDVCLIDYCLGGMDGLSFTQKLRQDKAYDDMVLIMVSGAMDSKPHEELKAKGLAGYIKKPFRPEHIINGISITLENKKLGRDAPLVTRHNTSRILENGVAEAGPRHQYPGRKVLVVEDMKMNMMLIKKVLSKFGVQLETAENGREACEKACNGEYDVIFMDCQMPEMDGFEATRAIRKHENDNGQREVPIVALTADAMVGDREKCISAGMNDYINKPFTESEIATALDRWLTDEAA